jgi:hypothetical protein
MASEPFVKRLFVVDGHDVECRFFQPQQVGHDCLCRLEIGWPEGSESISVYGVDGVQALSLAMQAAHAHLLAARDHLGREVSWLGEPTLGLPGLSPYPSE